MNLWGELIGTQGLDCTKDDETMLEMVCDLQRLIADWNIAVENFGVCDLGLWQSHKLEVEGELLARHEFLPGVIKFKPSFSQPWQG
jgi:hypothetical protein